MYTHVRKECHRINISTIELTLRSSVLRIEFLDIISVFFIPDNARGGSVVAI